MAVFPRRMKVFVLSSLILLLLFFIVENVLFAFLLLLTNILVENDSAIDVSDPKHQKNRCTDSVSKKRYRIDLQ